MNWTVEGKLEAISLFQEQLESILAEEGFSADLVHDMSLLTEEILVNIVSHGYGEQSAHSPIEIDLTANVASIVLEFRDQAPPFDPLSAPERDPDDERLGGWGIPLLKTLTDHISYRREGAYNILRLSRSERDS